MTSQDLLTSQELNFVMDEDFIKEIVNGGMEDEVIPEQYNEVPCNDEFGGEFNFEIFIDTQAQKNWMYSAILNKIFIISHTDFPVGFKWDIPDRKDGFYIRGMPIYSLPQDAHKPVMRCMQHEREETSNSGLTKLQRKHILRCVNNTAEYDGGATQHLSVVVPLTQPQCGTDIVRLMYKFVCKNSCTTGMNRRPIDVLFTLEDAMGHVYGRRSVGVRICSCPKRDHNKEEEEYRALKNGAPRGKKRKMMIKKPLSSSGISDTGVYNINVGIVGKRNAKLLAEYATALMAAEMYNRQTEEPYKAYHSKWVNLQRSFE